MKEMSQKSEACLIHAWAFWTMEKSAAPAVKRIMAAPATLDTID
jgi:hypothetical protein